MMVDKIVLVKKWADRQACPFTRRINTKCQNSKLWIPIGLLTYPIRIVYIEKRVLCIIKDNKKLSFA